MTISKTTQGWRVSDIINGHLVQLYYIGYTKREALQFFKDENHVKTAI